MLLHHHFIGTAKRYRNKLAFVDCSSGKDMRYGKALAGDLEWYKVFYYMRLTVSIFMCYIRVKDALIVMRRATAPFDTLPKAFLLEWWCR